MTARKRRLTDDEIEAEVLADLRNSSAWDEPVYVPPSNAPRPAWVTLGRHLELSARFHVLSVLHRLGAEASLTNAHPENIDIAVVHARGRALTIDVKTLIGTTKWFVEPFTARKNHFVAFVLYSQKALGNPSAAPDVVVIPSTRLRDLVEQQASTTINVHGLARTLGIDNPWQQLVTEAA